MFREMARKKQSLSKEQIDRILANEKRGVLSVHGENGYPYGLPINYWYDPETGNIYFHSGTKGHKIDAIQENNKVSFCVYDGGYRKDDHWALNISSVIVFGKMRVVSDPEEAKDIYKKLITIARNANAYVILDCDGEALSLGMESIPDLIKPNQEEFEALKETFARFLAP